MAMTTDSRWVNTKRAILELQLLLRCGVCKKTLDEPLSLGRCEHHFCRLCAEAYFGKACPSCGVPSHAKDVQPSGQLGAVTSLCDQLIQLLGLTENAGNKAVEEELVLGETSGAFAPSFPPEHLEIKEPLVVGVDSSTPQVEIGTVQNRRRSRNVRNLKVTQQKCWTKVADSPGDENNETPATACFQNIDDNKDSTATVRVSKRNRTSNIMKSDGNSGEDLAQNGKQNTNNGHFKTSQIESTATGKSVKENGSRRKNKRSLASAEQFPNCENHLENVSDNQLKTSSRKRFKRSPGNDDSKDLSEQNGSDNLGSEDGKKTRTRLDFAKLSTPPHAKSSPGNPKSTPATLPPSDATKSVLVTPRSCKRTEMKESPATPRNSATNSARKQNKKGETRLHLACIKGDLNLVHSLLEEGESPNVRDFANWTPLHEACNHGHTKIAELLLNYGAMINVPGGENATPLHDAVQNYRLECVRLLVSRGASKMLRDIHGKTPVDYAWSPELKAALSVPVTILDSPVSIPQSAESPSFRPKSVTLMTTGLDATSRSSVALCAKKLNWKIVNNFTNEVTHLVTSTNKEGVCMRTIKYLQAVVTGKWIVKFDWIMACADKSTLVDEEPFEITGTTHNPISYAPRKGRECVRQQQCLLFNGCHFYFHGDFCHPSPSKEDLSNLVKLGSGIILTREPKQETVDQSDVVVPYHADPSSSLANCTYFTVTSQADRQLTMINSRMCRVAPSWIVSCITEFSLVDGSSTAP